MGVDAQEVVVAGDSAGGGLTLALLQRVRDAKEKLPAAAILLSPWIDLSARGGTLVSHARFDWAKPEDFDFWAEQYLCGANARDPLGSPLYADLRGLPFLLVEVGGAEMLLDQVADFVARAQRAGVRVLFRVWPDMIHGGYLLAPLFGECRQAIDRLGKFIREQGEASIQ